MSEARSFFGLVNQVSYTFSMSSVMEPLRLLLKPDTWTPSNFSWTPELEESFKLAKQEIVQYICNGVKSNGVKSKHSNLGCEKLLVSVDHKPLLGLLNDKSLAEIDNPRLLMLKEKTLWYIIEAVTFEKIRVEVQKDEEMLMQ